MKEKIIIDLGRIMDEMFNAAQDFSDSFQEGFKQHWGDKDAKVFWDERVDYYPAFSFPPTNVYLTKDKDLVFEFALAGFDKESIDLKFQGDYMLLSAKGAVKQQAEEEVRYFKRRLKFKDINEQDYFVPADKFEQEKVKAVFKNGVLRVIIPAREEIKTKKGIKIKIVEEEEK